jgi:hypothetical protein
MKWGAGARWHEAARQEATRGLADLRTRRFPVGFGESLPSRFVMGPKRPSGPDFGLRLLRLLVGSRIGIFSHSLPLGGKLKPRSLVAIELCSLALQTAFLRLLAIMIGAGAGHCRTGFALINSGRRSRNRSSPMGRLQSRLFDCPRPATRVLLDPKTLFRSLQESRVAPTALKRDAEWCLLKLPLLVSSNWPLPVA